MALPFTYIIMGNSLSFRKAVSPIRVIIRNEEPLVGFEVCLWEQSHILYMYVLQLFTELIAQPPNAICSRECFVPALMI
jgi:hypothetical protein